jgi:endo-1,4-beta-mannosidase
MGVNYFRPGTGWAPQVWKQFDAEATRKDFAKLRALGGNCVRVFLSFGSFYMEPGKLSPDGLAKFDQFLTLAEEAGLYVHPTGPDHWEGLPEWARGDRIADAAVLSALEDFWRLFAARYRGRNVLFAYDLLNEPEVRWDTPAMRERWNAWLAREYGSAEKQGAAWGATNVVWGAQPVPAREARPGRELLDFQHCRESVAVEWTRRQVAAIRAADPAALATVGLIQWSVPVNIAAAWHYSAFRPAAIAPLVDFMEIHFYPLARGFYEYASAEDEERNLAYLESAVREVAAFRKPVVIAEFGWFGGGQLSLDGGKHPPATEEQQARWSRLAVETTAGMACGWLNWGFHDHPGAGDVTELLGLLKADGTEKAWAREFQTLARRYANGVPKPRDLGSRPSLDWELLIVDPKARDAFRDRYLEAYTHARSQ